MIKICMETRIIHVDVDRINNRSDIIEVIHGYKDYIPFKKS